MENFELAVRCGVVGDVVGRWNEGFFEGRGVHVEVLPRGVGGGGGVEGMDVIERRGRREREGVRRDFGGEERCRVDEGRKRVRAARKVRILVVGLEEWRGRGAWWLREGEGVVAPGGLGYAGREW